MDKALELMRELIKIIEKTKNHPKGEEYKNYLSTLHIVVEMIKKKSFTAKDIEFINKNLLILKN